jgi:hypothetical protein
MAKRATAISLTKFISTKTFALAALALVIVSAVATAARADTFQVSPGVEANWQKYLSKINDTNSGTFTVSIDGMGSFFVYCHNASGCGSVTEALTECRSNNHMDCRVMAKGSDPEFDFEVVQTSTPLKSGDPLLANILNEEDLTKAIVGNTASGRYLNGVKWAEYYSPDGKLHGKDDARGEYEAEYEIDDGKICYDYEGSGGDWCASVSRSGDHIEFIDDDGNHQSGIFGTVILPGEHL